MKSHVFITLGLLIGAIFFARGLDAIAAPGLSWREAYVFGGFLIAGYLIREGWKTRRDNK